MTGFQSGGATCSTVVGKSSVITILTELVGNVASVAGGLIRIRTMIIKGKFVRDWDKSKISTAYIPPNRFRVITWDMGRIQSWLLGQKPLSRNIIERFIG